MSTFAFILFAALNPSTFSTNARARHALNLETGGATFLGTYNIGGNSGDDLIYGAALAPPRVLDTVPESTSGLLFSLVGLVGAGFFTKRNKK